MSARFCNKCGAGLPAGARFCKACGSAVATAARPVCAYCGAEGKRGARFCKACGAPMEAAPDIIIPAPSGAEVYITNEPPVISPTCPNCGAQVRVGARFCKKCGASLTGMPAPKPRRPAASTYSSQRRSPQQQATPAKGASKGKSRRVFPRLVAAVLVVAIVITGVRHYNFYRDTPEIGGGYGGYAASGSIEKPVYNDTPDVSFIPEYTDAEVAAAPTVRLPVSPEATFARDEDVEVDFGDYNLLEQTTLSVARLPEKSVSSRGLSVTGYDLSMGNGINAFSLPVTITLPLTCAPDEVSDIRVFDESAGVWEAVPSTADYAAGTITFRTTHFCPIAEIKMKGARVQELTDAIPLQNGYFVYAGDFDSTGVLTPVRSRKPHTSMNKRGK